MKDILANLSTTDLIAALALLTALVSLVWNIVRDLIMDKMSVRLTAAVGGMEQINGSETALFADAGTQRAVFNIDKILFSIANLGRRPIVIFRLEGEYRKAIEGDKYFTIAIKDLPKKLEPYEVFSTTIPLSDTMIGLVTSKNLKNLWVEDTAGKKWKLGREARKRLEATTAIAVSE